MPWTPDMAVKHNKKATGKAGAQWSAVANSVLSKTGSDSRAIREANAVIARRKAGLDSVGGKNGKA